MPALTPHRATNKPHRPTPSTTSQAESPPGQPTDRVRLHITPFNPALLPKIIPTSLQAEARNISFHHTLVSPDKGFGYVELPAMAADALKKKLNGSILKGEKIKVHDAKPERRRKVEMQAPDDAGPAADEEPPQRKKRKVAGKVEAGVELPEGRAVKRGWTEPGAGKAQKRERTAEEKQARKEKKDKKREASKYTAEPEVLFKARLEPTAVTTEAMKAAKSREKAGKKEKRDKKGKSESLIHEFANTKKHAGFLRENQVTGESSMTTEFVEGKGWVDADGNVVEEAKPNKRRKSKKATADLVPSVEATDVPENIQEESIPVTVDDATDDAPAPPAMHPLEALYKRSKPAKDTTGTATTSPRKPPPIDTSKAAFSFFDTDGGAEDDGRSEQGAEGRPNLALPPMTPKTKQDFHMRGLRSAAPEPDTATQERRFSFSDALDRIHEEESDGEEAEDEEGGDDLEQPPDAEDDEGDVDTASRQQQAGSVVPQKPDSEFRKWFYEHRGENNRAWRQKRREAMKLKRQRENRRLARRVVV